MLYTWSRRAVLHRQLKCQVIPDRSLLVYLDVHWYEGFVPLDEQRRSSVYTVALDNTDHTVPRRKHSESAGDTRVNGPLSRSCMWKRARTRSFDGSRGLENRQIINLGSSRSVLPPVHTFTPACPPRDMVIYNTTPCPVVPPPHA